MRSIFSERACCKCKTASCGNVEDVFFVLDGVEIDTLDKLMEYIYTGQCMVKDKREVVRMIQLKSMLKLDINLELAKENIKKETMPNEGSKSVASEDIKDFKEPAPIIKKRRPSNSKLVNNPILSTPVSPIPTLSKHSATILKTEQGPKTEIMAHTPPVEQAEAGLSRSSGSILDRVVESIQPNTKYEALLTEPLVDNSFENIREEMYKEIRETEHDLDDTIPSIPTEMLIEELDNEEKRLTHDIMSFMDNMGDNLNEIPCTECGEQLSKDNFIHHYKTHVQSIQEAKDKMLTGNEVLEQSQIEIKPKSSTVENYSKSIFPTPPQIDESPPADISDEIKINQLQEEQKRISKDIVAFMSLFQQGRTQLKCSECQEVLTQVTIVGHFKKHITDLNAEIEVLVNAKRELKRKQEFKQKETLRKKQKSVEQTPSKQRISSVAGHENSTPTVAYQESDSFSKFLDSVCPRMGLDGSTSKDTPRNKEDERKKIYKRLYGRKKYQYRINNYNEDVKVSEDEIDAEIARSKAKYTGQPAGALDALIGAENAQNLTPGQVLQTFVQTGSKEYKHEFKKARDRLYKRKLRIVRMNGGGTGAMEIPRADIEIEMLTRYTSNKIKVDTMDSKKDPEVPCTNNWWEMTSTSLEPEMDITAAVLEANLDLGFGPGGEQWMSSNDPIMGEILATEYPRDGDAEDSTGTGLDMFADNYFVPDDVNTTLDEGADDMMAF